MSTQTTAERRLIIVGICALFLIGIFLRLPPNLFDPDGPLHWLGALHPQPASREIGFDEALYRGYVNSAITRGLGSYPRIVDHYIEVQKTLTGSILPPMRFLYIFAGWSWHHLFGTEALLSLRYVASVFSVLSLALSFGFAWRLKGPGAALGIGALVTFAPTQLHMSQHALVDGFFAFWALLNLWLLWENLRAPGDWRWLLSYVVALGCMTATKENAAFAYFAFIVLILANRWLRFGLVTGRLLACMFIGPLLGVATLVLLAGGITKLITAYELSVTHNYQLVYAITTGDGPWHRYLVDLLLVSPVVTLLAVAALFRLNRQMKPELFVAIFIAASYLVMCNVKYGMNLRYANMWDMPLRVLAFTQLAAFFRPDLTRRRFWLMVCSIALICALEMRQYYLLFVAWPLHELVSEGLLRALKILKTPPAP